MKFIKSLQVFLVAILIIGLATPISTEAAVVNSGDLMQINKTVSNNTLVKGETTEVTMTVKGTPKDSTFVKPNDVILIIDKSGSMRTDNRMDAAKVAAKEFIDLMDLTKHELGIVDFDHNVYSYPLTTDKTAAKAYVDTIQERGGSTNTSKAIEQATAILQNKRPDAQPTIVIMTDGAADSSQAAKDAAQAAKDAGITFYSIALLGPNENPDTSAPNKLLKEMASSFDHHHFVLGSVGLSDVYKAIVEEIGLASAYNVTITDTISPEFELVPGSYDHHIPKPTVTGNTIEWFISELKTNEQSFTYQVRAKADATAGKYPVAQTATTFEMGDGSIYSLNTKNPTVTITNHAPIITSVTEDKGLTTGGETVTITGQHFLPGATVYFGSKLAAIVSATDSEIIVTTPTGKQGAVVVKVENTDYQFATGSFNYYADPTITSITPAEGPLVGGNYISIIGSEFLRGAIVYLNGVESVTTFTNSSTLIAIVPAATQNGSVTVKVVNPDQTSVEVLDGYTYLAPPEAPKVELISLSPISGLLKGGELNTLTGKNFNRDTKVYFGDQEAVVASFTSSSKIIVTVPEGITPGFVSVKVVNPDNSTSELLDAYEYKAPPTKPAVELLSLDKTSGLVTGKYYTTLSGKNFDRNVQVFFGDQEATSVAFTSSSKLQVYVPQGVVPGLVSVKVENPDGSFSILTDAFEYLALPLPPAPEVSSLSDVSILIGKTKQIIVYGKNFSNKTKVFFGDQEAVTTFQSKTMLAVRIPVRNVPMVVDVTALNEDGQEGALPNAFTYIEPVLDPAPIITSLSSDSGVMTGNQTITITGQNFKAKATVYFGDKAASVISISDSEIVVKTPSATAKGLVSVKVINADIQEFILQDAYFYEGLKPIIKSLSPGNGAAKGGYLVTINGSNFVSKGMTVTVDGKALTTYTYMAANMIQIRMPAGSPGVVNITIDRDGETATTQFTYN